MQVAPRHTSPRCVSQKVPKHSEVLSITVNASRLKAPTSWLYDYRSLQNQVRLPSLGKRNQISNAYCPAQNDSLKRRLGVDGDECSLNVASLIQGCQRGGVPQDDGLVVISISLVGHVLLTFDF